MTNAQVTWSPRWYIWDGGFLALGRSSGVVPPHSHHAVQVCFAVDGEIRVASEDGTWRTCRGAIVRPDVVHSFGSDGALGVMLFVDPESAEGQWLRASLVADITVIPAQRLERCVPHVRAFAEQPLEALEPGDLIRHCVLNMCAGAPPLRRLDPRVAGVLAAIRASEDLRISLDDAAATVFLSPGRFAHLFTEHVGVPFRRYILWRKLARAMVAIGRGDSVTQAAHASGFADAAHLTRTFHKMWGIPPSTMMRGEFFVIPPPFDLQAA
jgi:AraC family transcriptional regulator